MNFSIWGIALLVLAYLFFILENSMTAFRIISVLAIVLSAICYTVHSWRQKRDYSILLLKLENINGHIISIKKEYDTNTGSLLVRLLHKIDKIGESNSLQEKRIQEIITTYNDFSYVYNSRNDELLKAITTFDHKTEETLSAFAELLGSAMMEVYLARVRLNQMQKDLKFKLNGEDWILYDGNIRKLFKPGKLAHVHDSETNTDMFYEYNKDDTVTIIIKINGATRYEIVANCSGIPMEGTEYGGDGVPKALYKYNQKGQVVERAPYGFAVGL
jgi:hypothetical protein